MLVMAAAAAGKEREEEVFKFAITRVQQQAVPHFAVPVAFSTTP